MKHLALSASTLLCLLITAAQPEAQCIQTALPSNFNPSFGNAVAVSGPFALIQSPSTVYAFRLDPAGWSEEQILALPYGADYHRASVAIDGDTAIVGAPYSDGQFPDSGGAFIYDRTWNGWVLGDVLVPADAARDALFGCSVSMVGDRVVIGARDSLVSAVATGAAYVFKKGPLAWEEEARLVAPDGVSGDSFGHAVSLSSTAAIVGAPEHASRGAVYVFELDPVDWVFQDKVVPTGTPGSFGSSVSIVETIAIVGDPTADSPAAAGTGVFHTLLRGASGWNLAAMSWPDDATTGDAFGSSVALTPARAYIGAPHDESDTGVTWGGSAYVFERGTAGWVQELKLVNPRPPSPSDEFGFAIAADGDWACVGSETAVGSLGFATFMEPCSFANYYCTCDSGAPCGNPDPTAGCANSSGHGAVIAVSGSASIAADDLLLGATNVPAGEPGLFYMGSGQSGAPFGDGLRCIHGGMSGLSRFPIRFASPAGVVSEGPGIVAFSQAAFAGANQIQPGQTWNFQHWHRDPLGPCGSSFNLTNAVAVTFGP